MAEHRSEKSCYKSRFNGGWITGQQFLAESMCDRSARKDKVELPDRFWTIARFEKEFRLQLHHAKVLLERFTIPAIIAALRTTRGKNVYSLGAKSILVPLIEYEQEKLNRQAEAQAAYEPPDEPIAAVVCNEAPRPAFVPRSSVISKLRDL